MAEDIPLWEKIAALRDEVLNVVELGDTGHAGGDAFDAIVRWVSSHGETCSAFDSILHEAIEKRLAWGEPEAAVLADVDGSCRRLLDISARALRHPADRIVVAEAIAEIGSSASRMIANAALGRAGRERAARLREEVLHEKLRTGLTHQQDELAVLEDALTKSDA